MVKSGGMMSRCHRFFYFTLLLLVFAAPTVNAEEVDLELVLAVDGSGSISSSEFKLQLAGYSAAFRDPELQAAITSGPTGRIAVAMMIWSDAVFPKFNRLARIGLTGRRLAICPCN